MGELVYTNSEGLVKASADFMEAAGKIAEIKKTLGTALNDFTQDMLGNAIDPMHNCALQIDGELFVANDRFSAISELLMTLLYTRSGIDNELGLNAAGKMQEKAGTTQFMSSISSASNSLRQQYK